MGGMLTTEMCGVSLEISMAWLGPKASGWAPTSSADGKVLQKLQVAGRMWGMFCNFVGVQTRLKILAANINLIFIWFVVKHLVAYRILSIH